VGRRLAHPRFGENRRRIVAASGGFHVGRAIFASIENGCVKFLRFEFNRRIAAAGVSQSLV
jgi:hypothetical protein